MATWRASLLLFASCGSSTPALPDAAPPDAAIDAEPTGRTVTASALNHYLPEDGVAVDLASAESWYVLGADGVKHPAVVAGSQLAFPNVPNGDYFICTGAFCVVSDADTIALDRHLAGRPSLTLGDASTRLMLTASNCAQAGTLDQLELPSQNTRAVATLAVGQLATSATGILSFASRGLYAAGDRIDVDQLVTRTSPAGAYQALGRTGQATMVAMAAGATTPTTVTMGADLPTTTLIATIASQDFGTGFVAQFNPDARFAAAGIAGFVELPGVDGYDPTLFDFQTTDPDSVLQSFTYADPFPAADARILEGYVDIAVDFTATGAGTKSTLFAIQGAYGPAVSLIEPVVGPPVALGVSGPGGSAQVGTTPTIAWQPPSQHGAPDFYVVAVHRIDITAASGTALPEIARFWTKRTSITVPTGVFETGKRYAVLVEADVASGRDIATAPFTHVTEGGFASVVSGVISP